MLESLELFAHSAVSQYDSREICREQYAERANSCSIVLELLWSL
jgi:hypothetical protein